MITPLGFGRDARLAQRLERRAQLVDEELGLFPCGEVASFGQPVVMNQLGERLLGPALWALIKLIGKSADGNGDLDIPGREKGEIVFRIQTSRRDRGVRQPEERDVVQDVVA